MRIKLICLLFIWLGSVLTVAAQQRLGAEDDRSERPSSKDRKMRGIDVGINVTSVISSFSGNGTLLEASDLPLFLRFRNKKSDSSAFRLGLGAKGTSSEFFDNVSFSNRVTKQQSYFMKAGLEISAPIDNKLQFYYGLDLLGNYVGGDVEAAGGNFVSKIDQRVIGIGVSPFLGLRFYIGERFYLSSEANLAYLHKLKKTIETVEVFDGTNNISRNESDTEETEFSLSPPLLYT